MARQPGFFDLDERYAALSAAGDPLLRLSELVDFEVFRPPLLRALRRSDRAKGGRPPYDPVLMFKVLVLQALYNLSDDQTEFQIRDRLSFMRFLGLGLHDRVPDGKTVWLFSELLVRAKAVEGLFDRFDAHLRELGYLAMSGQIVDASIVAAPSPAQQPDLHAGRQGGAHSGHSRLHRLRLLGVPRQGRSGSGVPLMRGDDRSARGRGGKLLWFATLWLDGVATVAAIAYGIRFILLP